MRNRLTLFLTIFLIFLSVSPCQLLLYCKPTTAGKFAYEYEKRCSTTKIYDKPTPLGEVDGTECLKNVKVGYFKKGDATKENLCDKFIELKDAFLMTLDEPVLEGTLATSSIQNLQVLNSVKYFKKGYLFFVMKGTECPKVPDGVNTEPVSVLDEFKRLI